MNLKNNSIILSIVFIVAFSRGIIELYLDKSIAYILQVSIILLGLHILCTGEIKKYILINKIFLFMWLLIINLSILSIYITALVNNEIQYKFIFVILFILLISIYSQVIFSIANNFDWNLIYRNVSIMGIFMVLVATLQQLDLLLIEFPGSTTYLDILRPQSITGSYLHYPIIISTIYIVFLCRFIQVGNRLDFFLMIIFCIGTFLSLSRYGMYIIVLSTFVTIIVNLKKSIKLLILFTGTFLLIIIYDFDNFGIIVERLISALITDSTGNETRVALWDKGLSNLSYIDLFVGTHFGLYTNSASDHIKDFYGVVESSPIQFALNIGVLATVILYLSIFLHFLSKDKSLNLFLISIVILTSTFFYQSLEVIPFIVVIYFLPHLILLKGGSRG